MPCRSILTASEKDSLVAIPESEEELIRYYTLSETDLSIIRQHRGAANRLGFAVQLCCMRYPGIAISTEQSLPQIFLEYLADQLEISSELWRADQYSPFSAKLVNVGVRDSTYVLDGLLYHESDLRIEEHYTDTAGFTDHVFALMHLLGFRFAPRIRDLADTKIIYS